MSTKEALDDLFADLVSRRQFEPFLRSVFELSSGAWAPLPTLVAGLSRDALPAVAEMTTSPPMVTWLADPRGVEREGYALVLCFWETALWSKVALVNRARLQQRQ